MTNAFGSVCFSVIFSASLLLTLAYSSAIPPLVMKTRELNENSSQCQSRFGCTYPFLFHIVGRSVKGTYQ